MNNYEIYKSRLLGEGSYSKVYYGIYTGPNNKYILKGTPIAAKILNNNTKLQDELTIMNYIKQHSHPNIVKCYDIFTTNQETYIILEYCDSGSLKDILKKPIKEKYVQFYFTQIKNALKHLHKHNIIHRDIKPKNILLSNSRKIIKIADFGFSKVHSQDLNQTMCGSPLYMAPEIINRNQYNNQTDLWSIGMILFEMLYGYHPYAHCDNILELKSVIVNEIIVPPNNNPNMNVSDDCINLLKNLIKPFQRITWEDFFTCPWLNEIMTISKSPNKNEQDYETSICANSIGSLANQVDIIPDYYDKIILDKSKSFSDKDKKINKEISNDQENMFEMELNNNFVVIQPN